MICYISNSSIFRGKQTAVKINNLKVSHWLNILCKRGGVKWRNCYQRNVNVTQMLTCTCTIIPEFTDLVNWPANSQYLNLVDFSVWSALQQNL